ncbi:MAG: hypothetical protein OXH95_00275 [bacterium]|nr:hypothetical protein [bacterium]
MRDDRGGITIFAIGIVVFALVLVAGLAAAGQVLIARDRVFTAAEAGALAAAPVTFRPFGASGSAAEEAAKIVRANGARLVKCVCPPNPLYDPRTVTVTAEVTVEVLGWREMRLEATAAAEFRPVALLSGN